MDYLCKMANKELNSYQQFAPKARWTMNHIDCILTDCTWNDDKLLFETMMAKLTDTSMWQQAAMSIQVSKG